MQSNVDEVNTVVQENLIAIRTVKAYVKGDYENEKFEKSIKNLELIVKKLSLFSTQHAFISIYDVYHNRLYSFLWKSNDLCR